jgi:phosphoglycerate dehydrogenase-like enzyme
MASSKIRVWLPEPDAAELMGGLPEGMVADVWTGDDQLPDSADEVEVVVLPFGVPASRMPVLVLAVILAQVRQLPRFLAAQRAGTWDPVRSDPLGGQTVLIVGYGSIGEAVERMLDPFGVTVKRIARRARPGVASLDELPALLPDADIVILLVPITPATTGLVDAPFLSRMHDHALLVNAARGPVVDTGALLAELRSGRLRAALDVTDPEPLPDGHPLWSVPGLLLTPHVPAR